MLIDAGLVFLAILMANFGGFVGGYRLANIHTRRQTDMETDKVQRFLEGFLAAAAGRSCPSTESHEFRDGWSWYYAASNQVAAEMRQQFHVVH